MFAEILLGSEFSHNYGMQEVIKITEDSIGRNEKGYRNDHVSLLYQYGY